MEFPYTEELRTHQIIRENFVLPALKQRDETLRLSIYKDVEKAIQEQIEIIKSNRERSNRNLELEFQLDFCLSRIAKIILK